MYQKITVVGYLGSDPEMRYMPDGTAVTSFSLATSKGWTDKATGEPVKQTTWFRVSVWGKRGENVNQYLSKGSKCLIDGELKPDQTTGSPRIWTRQDGTVGASFEITANNVIFLDSKGEGVTDTTAVNGQPTAQGEDEIPF